MCRYEKHDNYKGKGKYKHIEDTRFVHFTRNATIFVKTDCESLGILYTVTPITYTKTNIQREIAKIPTKNLK